MKFDFENKCFLNNGKKYEIVFLEDIDCSDMKIIKERKHKKNDIINGYRIVYYDKKINLYYKIWEKEYIHNASFTRAMLNNIFDNDLILPLKSLIFDKQQICRGYITYSGETTKKELIDIPDLYEKYKTNILNSKWILCDPVGINIVKYNKNYTFIDYEAVYPLKNVIKKNNELYIKINDDFLDRIKPTFYEKYLLENYF